MQTWLRAKHPASQCLISLARFCQIRHVSAIGAACQWHCALEQLVADASLACRAPEQFIALVTYLGDIASYLVPGSTFFDDVPLQQLLVANATNALGIMEPHALYGVRWALLGTQALHACGPAAAAVPACHAVAG